MSVPISEATESRLREAMARLLAGEAEYSDGALTIANLAREARVSHATVHRAVTVKKEFAEEVDRRRADVVRRNLERRVKRIGDLERKLAERNDEVRQLRALNDALAQQVQFLVLRGARLRRDTQRGRSTM